VEDWGSVGITGMAGVVEGAFSVGEEFEWKRVGMKRIRVFDEQNIIGAGFVQQSHGGLRFTLNVTLHPMRTSINSHSPNSIV